MAGDFFEAAIIEDQQRRGELAARAFTIRTKISGAAGSPVNS
jgi:hypothetical protein